MDEMIYNMFQEKLSLRLSEDGTKVLYKAVNGLDVIRGSHPYKDNLFLEYDGIVPLSKIRKDAFKWWKQWVKGLSFCKC